MAKEASSSSDGSTNRDPAAPSSAERRDEAEHQRRAVRVRQDYRAKAPWTLLYFPRQTTRPTRDVPSLPSDAFEQHDVRLKSPASPA